MDKDDILKYLSELNVRLKYRGIKGQIALFGGTVMCLSFNARSATKDVDAIFEPKQVIYDLARQIADDYDLPPDWLNDSVKAFVSPNHELRVFQNMSNLTIYVPSAEYMLAMKCMSARLSGAKDRDDIVFLIDYLGLNKLSDILDILQKYLPPGMIQPKTEYFLLELLDQREAEGKGESGGGR